MVNGVRNSNIMNGKKNDNLPFLAQGNFADIIDFGFKLYIRNFKTYFTISLLSYMPFYLIFLLYQSVLVITKVMPGSDCFSGILGIMVPNNPLVWMGSSLIIYNSGLFILGRDDKVPASYKHLKHFALRVIVWNIGFAAVLAFLFFLFFLIIPPFFAIFLSLVLSFTLYSVILEDKDIITAVKRSYGLITRNFSKFLMVMVFTSVMSFIPGVVYSTFLSDFTADYSWVYLLINFGSALVTVFVIPIPYIIRTFLFFDIKLREEATDLYLEVEKLEKNTEFSREDYNAMMRRKYEGRPENRGGGQRTAVGERHSEDGCRTADAGKRIPEVGSPVTVNGSQVVEGGEQMTDMGCQIPDARFRNEDSDATDISVG